MASLCAQTWFSAELPTIPMGRALRCYQDRQVGMMDPCLQASERHVHRTSLIFARMTVQADKTYAAS